MIKNTDTFVFIVGFFCILNINLSGCASYSKGFRSIEIHLANEDYPAALKANERTSGDNRDKVLYLMNKGMLLRMNGEFKDSNIAFEEAKKISRPLEAISVSEQAGAVTVNDSMRSYAGDPYERLMLFFYKALNYLQLGDPDSARVEIMQMDVRIQELRAKGFKNDAFARYVMGIVFELLEEWDDALIAYRNAYDAYLANFKITNVPIPLYLKYDLIRLTDRQGNHNELEEYKKNFKIENWKTSQQLSQMGELIVIVNNNLAPIKKEKSIRAVDGRSGEFFKVSIPYYETRTLYVSDIQIDIGQQVASASLVEDVSGIARRELSRQIPAITARAVARAVLKHKMVKTASKQSGLLGLAMNVTGVVSERADTRSWLTLPHNIYFARIPLEPGRYDVTLTLKNNFASVIKVKQFYGIVIEKNKRQFRSYHWVHAP